MCCLNGSIRQYIQCVVVLPSIGHRARAEVRLSHVQSRGEAYKVRFRPALDPRIRTEQPYKEARMLEVRGYVREECAANSDGET